MPQMTELAFESYVETILTGGSGWLPAAVRVRTSELHGSGDGGRATAADARGKRVSEIRRIDGE